MSTVVKSILITNLLHFKLQFYFDILLRGAHPCSRAAGLCLSEIGLCYHHFRRHTLTKTKKIVFNYIVGAFC